MAGVMKTFTMMLIAAVLMATVAPPCEAITCGSVTAYLSPCISYVTGKSNLSGKCCGGVKGLYAAVKSTPDRQSVCVCLKTLTKTFPSPAIGKASGLPGQCGVSIPYKISPSTDCNKVK